jgi:hypothetical protein
MSVSMSRFADYKLRVYDLQSVGVAGRALRVIVDLFRPALLCRLGQALVIQSGKCPA